MDKTTNDRMTVGSTSPPSTPRLRMEPSGSWRTLLDGGWWPRSTDPVAELPGLVLAIDSRHGPVTRLILSAVGWDTQPRRLRVAGRVLRLGYFASQPVSLLTALCGDRARIDLLIVAPDTDPASAEAAMLQAATTANHLHAPQLLAGVGSGRTGTGSADRREQDAWETEGGHLSGR